MGVLYLFLVDVNGVLYVFLVQVVGVLYLFLFEIMGVLYELGRARGPSGTISQYHAQFLEFGPDILTRDLKQAQQHIREFRNNKML